MKRIITSIALVLAGSYAFAQQDAQFSQNMFNKMDINPGFAGMNKAYCATLFYRDQWVGFPGNPTTLLFSADAYIPNIGGGLGLTVFDDKLGFESTLEVKLAYSYHLILGPGILGVGPEIGFYQKTVNGNWVAPDGTTTNANNITDPYIPTSSASNATYDLGLGAYYETPQGLYVGLSSSHLPEQTIKGSIKTYQYDVARHYYVMAGYTYNLSSTWDLKPDAYVESDASSTQFQIDLRAEYNKLIWFGVGYRMNDAFVGFIGLNYAINAKSNLKFGYSYDFTTSEIHSYSSGSHEIMLGYCFKITSTPKPTTHQNTRFL
jgi:type IX secretion system PorP/SprF family membrane protein